MDFRKYFDTMPRNRLRKILEELKVPFKLRVVAIRLYGNVISKFNDTKGWLEDIKFNVVVKKGFLLYLPFLVYALIS